MCWLIRDLTLMADGVGKIKAHVCVLRLNESLTTLHFLEGTTMGLDVQQLIVEGWRDRDGLLY